MTDSKSEKFGLADAYIPTTGDKVPPEQIWYHNWLYSVVPAADRVEDWIEGKVNVSYPLNIYLAGYCKNCNKSFTARLGHDQFNTTYNSLNIAKEGCVGPRI